VDTSLLRKLGLTEGESKVYLALIKIGSSTIGPILDESGITKSMIYRILEKLTKKGLVSYIVKEKTKYYQASNPTTLLDYVEKKKEDLTKTNEELKSLIPTLLMQQQNIKNRATIYQGLKGLMTAYENRYLKLQKGDEVVLYGLPAEQPEFHHIYWEKHHLILSKKGIKCRMLYAQDVSNEILKNRNGYHGCQAKKMPFNENTPSWVMIYKDVVLIAIPQGENPLGIEIENQEISDSFKTYFEWLWKI
jgi:sugar-specific transcriptional regulator TrmB